MDQGWQQVTERSACCGLETSGSCVDCPFRRLPDGTRLKDFFAENPRGTLWWKNELAVKVIGGKPGEVTTTLADRLSAVNTSDQASGPETDVTLDSPILKLNRALKWTDEAESLDAFTLGGGTHLLAKAVRSLIDVVIDLYEPPTPEQVDESLERLGDADQIDRQIAAASARKGQIIQQMNQLRRELFSTNRIIRDLTDQYREDEDG